VSLLTPPAPLSSAQSTAPNPLPGPARPVCDGDADDARNNGDSTLEVCDAYAEFCSDEAVEEGPKCLPPCEALEDPSKNRACLTPEEQADLDYDGDWEEERKREGEDWMAE
jgi:hypothetical protein